MIRFRRLLRSVAAAGLVAAIASPSSAQDSARVTSLELSLNLPAYRLEIREGERLLHTYRVAIGMRSYQTPVNEYAIREITWNPWWRPPKRDWAAQDTVTPPGPANPVGKVKMQFDSLLFMHGTPVSSSIGHAASHGCIRLRNRDAIAIARLIQERDGTAPDSAAMSEIISRWKRTERAPLRTAVPLRITYEIAVLRDTIVLTYPDVYRRFPGGHTQAVLATLAASGFDTMTVNRSALAALARRAKTGAASTTLRRLGFR